VKLNILRRNKIVMNVHKTLSSSTCPNAAYSVCRL